MKNLVTIEEDQNKIALIKGMEIMQGSQGDDYIKSGKDILPANLMRIYLKREHLFDKSLRKINGIHKEFVEEGMFYHIQKIDAFILCDNKFNKNNSQISVLSKISNIKINGNSNYFRKRNPDPIFKLINIMPGSSIEFFCKNKRIITYEEIFKFINDE